MPKMVGNGVLQDHAWQFQQDACKLLCFFTFVQHGAVSLFFAAMSSNVTLAGADHTQQVRVAFIHDTGMQTCAVQEVTLKSQDGESWWVKMEKIARCFYFCGDG
ncbi:hypothetical protein Droror1_Dr00009100 [Drosera rotundifolia]